MESESPTCKDCGDTGIVFFGCCSGNECGCMGLPIAAKDCKCGQKLDESKMSDVEKVYFEHVEYIED